MSRWTLVLHRHYHYDQPCLPGNDFSMNTPHWRTVVFFLLVLVYCPPSLLAPLIWPLPVSNPRCQGGGGGGYRYHPRRQLVSCQVSILQKLQHYKVVAKYSRRCFALVEKIDEQIKQGKTTITRSKELSQALFLTLYGRSEAEKYSILEKLANQEIKVSEIKKVSGQNFLFCFYFLYFYFKKG